MNYGKLNKVDSANGRGVRVTLFVSGCRNHCPGCFNEETWEFGYGEPYTKQTEQEILDALKPDFIDGLTLLGGEPFEEENQPELAVLLKKIREQYPQKNIWCYTGYTLEKDLAKGGRKHTPDTDTMLSCIDILVDGRFVLEQKDAALAFRGSRNQRIIDLARTRKEGQIVLSDYMSL